MRCLSERSTEGRLTWVENDGEDPLLAQQLPRGPRETEMGRKHNKRHEARKGAQEGKEKRE